MEERSVYVEKRVRTNYKPGDNIRPLECSEYVTGLAGMKYKNDFNTVKLVWVESDQPIDLEKVREAIVLVAKNISVLQLCVKRRLGKLWFQRMQNFAIDFDSSEDDYMSLYEYLMETPYDFKNGPLWRVRFVKSRKSETSDRYTSIIGYAIQHCISDGPTSMTIIKETIRLLNNLIKGEKTVPIMRGMSPFVKLGFNDWAPISFMAKTFWVDLYESGIQNFNDRTTFKGLLPTPITNKPKCKLFIDDLTREQTQRMLTKCKAENVTVHHFITACCNYALLRLAQRRSKVDIGKHLIKVAHCVNSRRYFKEYEKSTCGCHFIVQPIRSENSLKDDFWESVRAMQAVFKVKVEEEEEPMKLIPFGDILIISQIINNYLTSISLPQRTQFHYSTTNMGNLKEYFPEPDPEDPVEISYLVRSVKNVMGSIPFLIGFQTLRNRFMISMDCFTGKMPEDVGREYFSILGSYIKQVANTGQINLMD